MSSAAVQTVPNPAVATKSKKSKKSKRSKRRNETAYIGKLARRLNIKTSKGFKRGLNDVAAHFADILAEIARDLMDKDKGQTIKSEHAVAASRALFDKRGAKCAEYYVRNKCETFGASKKNAEKEAATVVSDATATTSGARKERVVQ